MKLVYLAFVAATLLAGSDPQLTSGERSKALQLLDDSEKEFLSYVSGLSEAQWNFKASPEKWSVGQTAEHIMLSESLIFSAVTGAMKAPVDPDWAAKSDGKAAKIETMMLNRSAKATAPEPLQPQSKLSREEIISRYKAARAKTIAFTKTTDLPLKEHLSPHPYFGQINAYEWLICVPLHNLRHDQQIAEVKASPEYPR